LEAAAPPQEASSSKVQILIMTIHVSVSHSHIPLHTIFYPDFQRKTFNVRAIRSVGNSLKFCIFQIKPSPSRGAAFKTYETKEHFSVLYQVEKMHTFSCH
jgi:hypothetical protein